jgi:hypothetical protein
MQNRLLSLNPVLLEQLKVPLEESSWRHVEKCFEVKQVLVRMSNKL